MKLKIQHLPHYSFDQLIPSHVSSAEARVGGMLRNEWFIVIMNGHCNNISTFLYLGIITKTFYEKHPWATHASSPLDFNIFHLLFPTTFDWPRDNIVLQQFLIFFWPWSDLHGIIHKSGKSSGNLVANRSPYKLNFVRGQSDVGEKIRKQNHKADKSSPM